MMKNYFLLTFVGLAMAGCVRQEKAMSNSFALADHERFLAKGTSKIEGQAFLRQQGGAVVRCSGEEVRLAPDTPYFRELRSIARDGGIPKDMTTLRQQHSGALRRTLCDADGKFVFSNIPAGTWFVDTRVIWMAGSNPQGGVLNGEVTTVSGQTASVILSEAQFLGR